MPNLQGFTVDWDSHDDDVEAVLGEALRAGAEYVKATAVPLAPIRDGILRGSAGTDVDTDDATASVYFDTPYAQEQHENLAFRHREGQAKYLETALDESRNDVADIIAAKVRRAFQ